MDKFSWSLGEYSSYVLLRIRKRCLGVESGSPALKLTLKPICIRLIVVDDNAA